MKRYNDFFGSYGGRFVAEMLRAPLDDLQEAFLEAAADPAFTGELDQTLRDFAGRPTPLLKAENATRELGGAAIYIKCEGQAHTGAHKINNAVGQALLARRMGKTRIIAETGAGQHGVATAAVCARLGLPCRVYMGEVDMRRQRPNVFWMERYGAEVVPGHDRFGDAEGRGQRSSARLGGELSDNALSPGLGPRTFSVPRHGAGVPVGDRPGSSSRSSARSAWTARRSSRASGAGRMQSASFFRSWRRRRRP